MDQIRNSVIERESGLIQKRGGRITREKPQERERREAAHSFICMSTISLEIGYIKFAAIN